MDNETILPCPFCGAIPKIEDEEWIGDYMDRGAYVECWNNDCPCEPRTYSNKELTESEAIKLWNTRIDKQED